MKKLNFSLLIGLLLIITSCNSERNSDSLLLNDGDGRLSSGLDSSSPGGFSGSSSGSSGSSSGSTGNGQDNQSGLITAGEWNDLENWSFWNDLIAGADFIDEPSYWNIYNNNRISILLENLGEPIIDEPIQLLKNGTVVWEARTDNLGKAEMWIDVFEENHQIDLPTYSLKIDGEEMFLDLKRYSQGVNEIDLNTVQNLSNRVELNFIVDATGSMGDELEFLKDDLADVIQRVQINNRTLQIYTSSVFYRDEGDDYVTRKSDFSGNLNNTLAFINDQSAGGGGDFPEAVHSALKVGIEELQWSDNAKTRIAFLLLDAPPHHDSQVIRDLQFSIKEAAKKGIKVVPITASGINKETEYLMRLFSVTTNSTYVFITDDSGIGNPHLEPTVGDYDVEFLSDLMVRLINEYSD